MKEFLTNLGLKIAEIVTSKRMIALYWHSGAMIVAGLLDIVIQQLTAWNPGSILTIGAGLIFAQISKYLNTKKEQHPLPETT